MLVGVVSDTHNNIKNVKDIIDIFNTEKVDVVVHIPAAETLANIKGSVGNMVDNQITKGINDMLAKHFPQIGRQSTFTKTPLGPMGQ